jgi:hypothetical protein
MHCVRGKAYDYDLVICSILAECKHAMRVMAIQEKVHRVYFFMIDFLTHFFLSF